MDESSLRTNPTLLGQLRAVPHDQTAWARFVTRYGPLIHAWCRQWGLQHADVADVTQIVLLKLSQKMADFEYEPAKGRFRSWLKTVVQHALDDFVNLRWRDALVGGVEVHRTLAGQQARMDLETRLSEEFDLERKEQAEREVESLVEPTVWEAYRLTAVEGSTGAEVASQLHLPVASIYTHKHRVQKLLQEKLESLRRADEQ